jgi:hypothetical protein
MLHDYLRDTLVLRYIECKSCGNRTQFACVRCGYCYSCHWKKEKIERALVEPLARSDSTFLEKYPLHAAAIIEEEGGGQSQQEQEHPQQEQIKVIDVFGQKTEPVCNYHTYHHKFSIHSHSSSHICKCHHPFNYATGVSISPITTKNKDKRKVLRHYDRKLLHYNNQKHSSSKDKGLNIDYYLCPA